MGFRQGSPRDAEHMQALFGKAWVNDETWSNDGRVVTRPGGTSAWVDRRMDERRLSRVTRGCGSRMLRDDSSEHAYCVAKNLPIAVIRRHSPSRNWCVPSPLAKPDGPVTSTESQAGMPSPRISSTAGTPVDNRWGGGLPPITPPPDDVNKLQVADPLKRSCALATPASVTRRPSCRPVPEAR